MGLTPFVVLAGAQAHAQKKLAPQQVVTELVANERRAALQMPPVLYTSIERSRRTKGHLWIERVVEIPQGRLHYLVSEDGHPLSTERHDAEVARLKSIARNPRDFLRREQARKDDEHQALRMLALLPRAFLFTGLGIDGPWLRIGYRPNPAYVPHNFEERVMHGMSGFMLIDAKHLRLHYLEGQLNGNATFGFGLLATIQSGSRFAITRDPISPGIWKTTAIDTNVDGRIIFFKTITRQQHTERRDFVRLPPHLSISQAIALLISKYSWR